MQPTAELYDSSYAQYSARVYEEIRVETYGVDLGQTGWMTALELGRCCDLLGLRAASNVLEVGCGAGGCAVHIARSTNATVTGIDINENGIRNARELARSAGLAERLRFEQIDAGQRLPFADEWFDAVFSNDAMCHIEPRMETLSEWRRVLKRGGQMLFTDAMVISGIISNEEIAIRSSIGFYLFLPKGENERFIEAAGFELTAVTDVTASAAEISGRWRDARAKRRSALVEIEGEPNFLGLQRFLDCVHRVSQEGRLSRFLYVAERPRA